MSSGLRNSSFRDRTAGGGTGIGRCFGTFGELLQGALPDEGRAFLVTLPVARYSTARFTASSEYGGIQVHPPAKVKSRRLAEELVRALGPSSGGLLEVKSDLPPGKGCASSSADMVATARAIQSALGIPISRAVLARIMSGIEPSDGVMYPGIVSFYHREGVLRRFLGPLRPLTIVGIDEGGEVDTVEFNLRPGPDPARRVEYEELLVRMERAIARGDLRSVGEISTRSAILNQEILPKAHLDLLLKMRREYGALGVAVAHSGTQLGLLFGPDAPSHRPRTLSRVVAELARQCPSVRVHRVPDLRTARNE